MGGSGMRALIVLMASIAIVALALATSPGLRAKAEATLFGRKPAAAAPAPKPEAPAPLAEAAGILSMLLARLEGVSDLSGEWFMSAVKEIGDEFGLKGRELWHPVRAAIAGRVVGPDMITIVETFGLEKCRERISTALSST